MQALGAEAPTPVVIPIPCAPKKAPGPNCGRPGRRTRTFTRGVRTVAYPAVASLELTGGESRARCDRPPTFRNAPEGVLPRALDDTKVRDLVLHRILDDGPGVERALESLPRESLLDLATGFAYDVLPDRGRQLDRAGPRREALARFSGTPCVGERHPGRFTPPLATDPLADLPVAFALVGANDQGHMRRSLRNLKDWGLAPGVVVTDGSNLYPAVLAQLWPDADHPLCAFPVLKDLNKLIPDPVRRRRSATSRRGKAGRKKRRGRKGAKSQAAAARRGMTVKEKAHFVSRRRHLIVKRRENLSGAERADLVRRLDHLPALATRRRFADRIAWRFDAPKDLHPASCRRGAIVRAAASQAVPELAKARKPRDAAQFPKVMASLARPVGRRVRTNHHVERTDRRFRLLEEVR